MGIFNAPIFRAPVAMTGSIVTIKTGMSKIQSWIFFYFLQQKICSKNFILLSLSKILDGSLPPIVSKSICSVFDHKKSDFEPKLESQLGEGGQAKVFKAKFHGQDVAMKYVPLDKVKDNYEYKRNSYGCHEFYQQEKVFYWSQWVKMIVNWTDNI